MREMYNITDILAHAELLVDNIRMHVSTKATYINHTYISNVAAPNYEFYLARRLDETRSDPLFAGIISLSSPFIATIVRVLVLSLLVATTSTSTSPVLVRLVNESGKVRVRYGTDNQTTCLTLGSWGTASQPYSYLCRTPDTDSGLQIPLVHIFFALSFYVCRRCACIADRVAEEPALLAAERT
eukprot:scaffold388480_cov19-Prasinocladus_malaysianus.AAC.1